MAELKAIWRRQRIDLEVQVRYYANGMFEDYYKVGRSNLKLHVELVSDMISLEIFEG